jgi:hypothetical protein
MLFVPPPCALDPMTHPFGIHTILAFVPTGSELELEITVLASSHDCWQVNSAENPMTGEKERKIKT